MKVLHVYRTYFPDTQGGLEEVIRQTCSSTGTLGAECRVFVLSKNPKSDVIKRPEADVYQVRQDLELSSCSISFSAMQKFKACVAWADIVQYHFPWPFADFLHFAAGVDKPTLLTYHSDIVRQQTLKLLYKPLMRKFLAAMDKIVCTSPNYFATSDVLSSVQEKVEVIPIGLDARHYTDTEVVQPAMRKPYFLFIGVLRYYKGLHILLDAMVGAPYQVVIVGSGPIESELQKQISELKLNNVTFTGYVSDAEKIALIKNSLCIVFPSYLRSEAFGVTLLEGAMFGKPLISTEVGSGTSHVNIHMETGLVVTPGSAKTLRVAMDKMHESPDLAKKMGLGARKRYEQLFTAKLMGERYFLLYNELLGIPPTPAERVDVPARRS